MGFEAQDCEGVVNSGEKGLVIPNPFFLLFPLLLRRPEKMKKGCLMASFFLK